LRRTGLLVAVLALALAGCGGGSSNSTEKESVQAFQKRLTTAISDVHFGLCLQVSAFNRPAGFGLVCSNVGYQRYKGFRILAAKQYGKAGVVEFVDAEVSKARTPKGGSTAGKRGVYTVAISQNKEYAITGPPAVVSGSTVNSAPARVAQADAAARKWLASVRAANCKAFARNTLLAGSPYLLASGVSNAKQDPCASLTGDYGILTRELKLDPRAVPKRIGGNATFVFYGLTTGKQYRTLIVMKNPAGGSQAFISLGTLRGPDL
jgi:hypothetical protein